jgi:hypothetical protein
MGADGRDIGIGDVVDVPGGMHGTVKFIGAVSNKKGVFAGVELSREYSSRGKNDGEVDGYVNTACSRLPHTNNRAASSISGPPYLAQASSYPYIVRRNGRQRLRTTSLRLRPRRHRT